MAYVVELNMLMSTKQRVTKRTILDDQLMMMMMMKLMKMLLMVVMVMTMVMMMMLMSTKQRETRRTILGDHLMMMMMMTDMIFVTSITSSACVKSSALLFYFVNVFLEHGLVYHFGFW